MTMQSIEAEITVTADDTDAFNGTDLETAPGPGGIAVYLASTVADSRATVHVGSRVMKTDSIISKVGTNAQIDVLNDAGLFIGVRGGEKVRVTLDVVTAATIRAKAMFLGVPI